MVELLAGRVWRDFRGDFERDLPGEPDLLCDGVAGIRLGIEFRLRSPGVKRPLVVIECPWFRSTSFVSRMGSEHASLERGSLDCSFG